VRRGLAAIPGLTDEVAATNSDASLLSVVGIGAEVWDRLYPAARPPHLRPFAAFDGPGGTAPSTPADLFAHIRCDRLDLNFELGHRVCAAFGDGVSVIEEVTGFRYLDYRDLTGFVDGTENPAGDHRGEVAMVADEDPDWTGSSYVAIQRYIHDLAAWENLPVADQERIIARTKADNVEFNGDAKAATAHIKRVSIKEDGKSLEVLRHSMPYGTTSEHGLYFVAYGRTPDAFELMLEQMIVGDADGNFDHLMSYSRAVTGASFFCPSRDWLEASAA
jgi:putative iron-dependent peroxidase